MAPKHLTKRGGGTPAARVGADSTTRRSTRRPQQQQQSILVADGDTSLEDMQPEDLLDFGDSAQPAAQRETPQEEMKLDSGNRSRKRNSSTLQRTRSTPFPHTAVVMQRRFDADDVVLLPSTPVPPAHPAPDTVAISAQSALSLLEMAKNSEQLKIELAAARMDAAHARLALLHHYEELPLPERLAQTVRLLQPTAAAAAPTTVPPAAIQNARSQLAIDNGPAPKMPRV